MDSVKEPIMQKHTHQYDEEDGDGEKREIVKPAEMPPTAKGCPLVATTFKIEFLKSCIPSSVLLISIVLLMSAFGFRPLPV